jgi:NNP family nitrate/nitrite transporter-like MFS transporter
LSDIYVDAYGINLKSAGLLATSFTFTAGLARIPGGRLADRFGARAVVRHSLIAISVSLAPVVLGPPLAVTGLLFFAAAIAMGAGMAGTMRYLPDYFPKSVGAAGGIVGALGGLGGFFLPLLGNAVKASTGSVFLQVAPLLALAILALAAQTVTVFRLRMSTARFPQEGGFSPKNVLS